MTICKFGQILISCFRLQKITLVDVVEKLKLFTLLFLFIIPNKVLAQVQDSVCSASVSPLESDSVMKNFLLDAGVPVTTNNRIKVIKSGKEKFEDLFAVIGNAKHHIHLEYFNFRNDSIANALFDLLAQKAREGVQVRAIFDAFGNWSNSRPLKKKHLKAIRNRGIEIYHFDPLKFPYVNHVFHRDHRKIAIVDGTVAYTGGMNIADYYIKGLPEIGPWHDTHMRIEGDAVIYLQKIFLTMWNKTAKQNIGGPEYFPEIVTTGTKSVAIVDRVPRKMPELMRKTYAASIRAAQDRIQIVNPYFLPTRTIKKELKAAIKRGVLVEIMISSKADIGFTPEGSLHVANRLMKKGAHIYLYNGGFHHSKIMMVDNSFCTIGTTNLDSRSLRFDYEVNAFIFDKEVTNELNEMFESDKADCTFMTPVTWKKRSVWKKFVGWTANVFTPLL